MVYLGKGLNIQFPIHLVAEVYNTENENAILLPLNIVVKIVMAQYVKSVTVGKPNVHLKYKILRSIFYLFP